MTHRLAVREAVQMIQKVTDMLAFASPLRVYLRSENLVIHDYRPTLAIVLCLPGGLVFAGFAIWFAVASGTAAMFSIVTCCLLAVGLLLFALQQSIRESYYFDKETDSYRFVRQFIHKKEVIEGSLDQFTGASVKTVQHSESESYHVVLNQEGMFLTGVSEQTLRGETPLFNSFSNEARIANAISSMIHTARYERKRKSTSK